MGYTKKFGKFVQKRRQEIGMTQKELSLQIFPKINIDYVSKLENEDLHNITFATAEKILKALNAKMEFKGRADSKIVKNQKLVQTELFD